MSDHPERRETDWLWNEISSLRGDIKEQHQRLRSDMHTGFDKLATQIQVGLDAVGKRVDDHSTRLVIIETERGIEKREAIKRGTWAGLAAASSFSLIAEYLKAKFGWPNR